MPPTLKQCTKLPLLAMLQQAALTQWVKDTSSPLSTPEPVSSWSELGVATRSSCRQPPEEGESSPGDLSEVFWSCKMLHWTWGVGGRG